MIFNQLVAVGPNAWLVALITVVAGVVVGLVNAFVIVRIVVPDASTSATISGRAVELTGDGGGWGAVLVHGPAPEKVVTRIALLRSLERVGGRRG